jgi:tetratricopeptide (TPR) repeat protein
MVRVLEKGTPVAPQTPTVRQISWVRAIPSLMVIAIAATIGFLLDPRNGVLWGIAAYVLYSLASRDIIAHAHRAGIRLTKQKRFAEAIPKFQESLAFFERHAWIDRFRPIVLLSSSAMSYQEMALVNIAFCHTQIGQGAEGRRYYEKCLQRFPNSGLAASALRMLDSVSQPPTRDITESCG